MANIFEDWLKKPKQTPVYTPGQSVNDAYTAYQSVLGNKPGDYVSQYQDQMNTLFNSITNRKPFQYDMQGDALYQQYKDQYTNLGNMAMQDTMGQAAAQTGGYGNSYASTAGNQAYQGYLQRLNEIVPQLEARAQNRYDREGADLYNQYSLTASADQTDYGRYQDLMNQWMNDQSMAYGQYRDEQGFDYGKFRDTTANNQWQQSFDYGVTQDMQNQTNWKSQYDYQQQQDAAQMAFQQAQFDWRKAVDARDYAAAQAAQARMEQAQAEMAALEQQRWQSQFDWKKQQDAAQLAFQQSQFDWQQAVDARDYAAAQVASQSGGSTGGSSGGSGGTDKKAPTEDQVAEAYKILQRGGGNAAVQTTGSGYTSALSGTAGLETYLRNLEKEGVSSEKVIDLYEEVKEKGKHYNVGGR